LTDRRATIRSAKSCIYLAHEKTCTVWGIFFHSHTQSDPEQGIKKFPRHFPTALVPSLTLQISDIIRNSLESHTLEFFAYHLPYSRSRCLVAWQREVKFCKVSDGTRVIGKSLRNFCYFALSQVVQGSGEIYRQTVRKKYTTFSTEGIVALRSVNKIFPESYDIAASFCYGVLDIYLGLFQK
jgi:hypothetical protein